MSSPLPLPVSRRDRSHPRAVPVAMAVALALSLGATFVRAQDPPRPPGSSADTLSADALSDRSEPTRRPLPAEVVVHLDHLTASFFDTPGGRGLLDTGMAEAAVALQYVGVAGRDSTNLGAMRRNMANVLHAIDPREVGTGPGSGYGFKQAAEAVGTHIALAVATDGASESVFFHGSHVALAARGASARADEAIALARSVQGATDARQGMRLLRRLRQAVVAMAYGDDRDDDGRIGFTEPESGLAQARYHLILLRRVEGLASTPGR